MFDFKKNMIKSEGVTLISLCVTIIVLIIIATIGISTVIKEDGVLTETEEIRVENRIVEIKNLVEEWEIKKSANEYVSVKTQTASELIEELKSKKFLKEGEYNGSTGEITINGDIIATNVK